MESLSESGIYRRLLNEGHRFEFAQALRLLELAYPEAPALGETARYGEVAVRLRPSSALVFPPTDVKHVERFGAGENRVCVELTFLGLYGIDSPLPYHFYESLAKERRDTDPHREFLDIFSHRFYAFFYRAWKKYRPSVQARSDSSNSLPGRFICLAGLGTVGIIDEEESASLQFVAHAGLLSRRARNAEGLEAFIRAFLDDVPVEVVENVPRWVPVPSRSGLGEGGLLLGRDATIGEAVYDRSGKFRLCLGPMSLDLYHTLLPGGEKASLLHRLVRLYVPNHLAYDVELSVSSDELPTTQLGGSGAQLGYTMSLGAESAPTASTTTRIVEYE